MSQKELARSRVLSLRPTRRLKRRVHDSGLEGLPGKCGARHERPGRWRVNRKFWSGETVSPSR